MGRANANVARMVVAEINANGGLLGRKIELYLEDGATTDAVAEAKAAKLVSQDKVDVIFGGIYSSTRQAIKGPAVVKGRTLYIYPEQYEGQECDPLIFCTGPVPAQQLDPLIPWLMRKTGAKTFYLPSADYIWPRVMNERVRQLVTANGGSIVDEEYYPLDHMEYDATVGRIMASGAEVVFNTIVPPGVVPFFRFSEPRRATDLHLLRREPARPAARAACGRPLRLPRLLPERQRSLQQDAAQCVRQALSRRRAVYRRQRLLRPLSWDQLWAAAVNEAGSLRQEDVIAALDHARIAEGPGGPAEMVPGQHHVRLNMYIAQAKNGCFEIVENLGAIAPDEAMVPSIAESGRRPIA
ncbi:transporter substrate-binding protein [Bradyrhizobium sp. RDM12]